MARHTCIGAVAPSMRNSAPSARSSAPLAKAKGRAEKVVTVGLRRVVRVGAGVG